MNCCCNISGMNVDVSYNILAISKLPPSPFLALRLPRKAQSCISHHNWIQPLTAHSTRTRGRSVPFFVSKHVVFFFVKQ